MGEFILAKEVNDNFSKESFTFSCFDDPYIPCDIDDKELFFDMDVTLPLNWDSDTCTKRSSYDTLSNDSSWVSEAREFEFSLKLSKSGPGLGDCQLSYISPADDLFYKGQLLPLHLPPRIQMVEQLSASNSASDLFEAAEHEEYALDFNQKLAEGDLHSTQDMVVSKPPSWVDSVVTDVADWAGGAGPDEANKPEFNSHHPWITLEQAQDANVFPHCYQDPALTLMEENVGQNHVKCHSSTWRRPSLRWKAHDAPAYRRNLEHEAVVECGSVSCTGIKQRNQKGGHSVLSLIASASFVKSLFAAGDLKVHKERKSPIESERVKEDARMKYSMGLPDGLTTEDIADRRRVPNEGKATNYLNKYTKIFKSVYIYMLSHKLNKESLLVDRGATNRSLSNFSDHSGELTKPHLKSDFLDRECSLSCSSSSCLQEAQSSIRGAIAHCKQSASHYAQS